MIPSFAQAAIKTATYPRRLGDNSTLMRSQAAHRWQLIRASLPCWGDRRWRQPSAKGLNRSRGRSGAAPPRVLDHGSRAAIESTEQMLALHSGSLRRCRRGQGDRERIAAQNRERWTASNPGQGAAVTHWQSVGITRETVTAIIVRGLLVRNAAGLSHFDGRWPSHAAGRCCRTYEASSGGQLCTAGELSQFGNRPQPIETSRPLLPRSGKNYS
jgi:hypothetical protein